MYVYVSKETKMGPERLPNRLDMIGAPLRGACAACSKYSEKHGENPGVKYLLVASCGV